MEVQEQREYWNRASARYRATPKYRETLLIRKARPGVRAAQRAADRRFKEAHPQRRKAQYSAAATKIRAADPEHAREISRRSAANRPAAILFNAAKQRARKYNIEFTITLDSLLPLPTHCPVFSVKLEYGGGKGKIYNPNAASLDRFDSHKGYVLGNIVIMSRRANSIKNDGTADDHRRIAAWMETAGDENGFGR